MICDIANFSRGHPSRLNIPRPQIKQAMKPNLKYLNGISEDSLARRINPETNTEPITPEERIEEPLPKARKRVVSEGNLYALSTKKFKSNILLIDREPLDVAAITQRRREARLSREAMASAEKRPEVRPSREKMVFRGTPFLINKEIQILTLSNFVNLQMSCGGREKSVCVCLESMREERLLKVTPLLVNREIQMSNIF